MNRETLDAAEAALDLLERGQAIGTEILSILVRSDAGTVAFLQRRRHSGFVCTTNRQRLEAMFELRSVIERHRQDA